MGQTLAVTLTLVNGETSEAKLGWILYRLRIEPDILALESAEAVEHTLTLEPGDWDQAEFVLCAVEPGRVTINRVIAADRPGIGDSEYQPARKFLDWPADLVHLADTLGFDRFGVVGISGGGPFPVP